MLIATQCPPASSEGATLVKAQHYYYELRNWFSGIWSGAIDEVAFDPPEGNTGGDVGICRVRKRVSSSGSWNNSLVAAGVTWDQKTSPYYLSHDTEIKMLLWIQIWTMMIIENSHIAVVQDTCLKNLYTLVYRINKGIMRVGTVFPTLWGNRDTESLSIWYKASQLLSDRAGI